MANNTTVTKTVEIKVEAEDALSVLKEIRDALDTTSKEAKKAGEDAKKAGGFFSGMGKAISSIAGALGIVAILGKLAEMFMKNKVIADLVTKGMAALQLGINTLVEVGVKLWKNLSDLWEKMDGLKAVLGSLVKMYLTPFKLAFYEIKGAILILQLAWESSLFGKKRPEEIKRLKGEIAEVGTNIKEVAVGFVDAGKSLVNNFGKALTEVAEVGKTSWGIFKEGAKSFKEQLSSTMANSVKNFEAIAILAEREQKKYEGLAEKQRQIRDDTTKSYQERIQASKDLALILDKEEAAAKRAAQARLEDAIAKHKLDTSNEAHNAVLAAENALEAIRTDYIGKRSEGLTSLVGVNKEMADSTKAITDELQAQYDELKKVNDEAERNSLEKSIQSTKDALIQSQMDRDALNQEILNSENSTYAQRRNALKDYLDITAKDENMSDVQKAIEKRKIENELIDQKKQAALDAVNTIRQIDQGATAAAIALQNQKLKNGKITQEEYDKNVAKIQEKAAKREKAYAIFSAIINTAAGIAKAIPNIPLMALAGIIGAAQIAMILATKVGDTGAATAPSATAPSTSEGTSPNTSFSFSPVSKMPEQQPVKTYVLTKDVQTSQQLERATIANGTV